MCSSKVVEGQTSQHGQHQCACSQQVEARAGLNARKLLAVVDRSLVGLPAQAAEGDGLAACCSGGFTGTDVASLDVTFVDSDSEKFGFVDGASVVATGSCCNPAVDLLASYEEGQDVLNLERVNGIPTKSDGFEWVHNGDALVTDDQLGAHEDQPNPDVQGSAPKPNTRILPIASNHGDAQQDDKCCQSNAAQRPINLRVSHASIIAGDN